MLLMKCEPAWTSRCPPQSDTTPVTRPFVHKSSFTSVETWVNRQVMLSVAQLILAAKYLGVETCLLENYVQNYVRAAFGMPEDIFVCCLIPLGYAADPLKNFGGRFDLDKVVFEERYNLRPTTYLS